MGSKYSSVSITGYNATPPSDDGAQTESNKSKWATIKTKLSDPVKTALESVDSRLATALDHGPTALISNTTLGASDYEKFIQVSGSGVTLSLSDAASLGAGWNCWIVSTDSSNTTTISRATGGDTINGSASNYTLQPLQAVRVFVNAAASGFLVRGYGDILSTVANTFTANQTISSTDAGATIDPQLILDRNSATPAASDVIGAVSFKGRDSGGGTDTYAQIQTEIVDHTAASEDGRLAFRSAIAGTLATRLYLGAGLYTVGGSDQGANTIQGFSGVYDGTNRVYSAGNTVPEAGLAASAVSRAKLKTTTASGNTGTIAAGDSTEYTLTGSTYSWWTASSAQVNSPGFAISAGDTAAGVLGLSNQTGGNSTAYVDERYVQASPPYHHLLYVYALMNPNGSIDALSVAPDPVWAYHGPTDITPQWLDGAGKPFRKVKMLNGIPLATAIKNPALLNEFLDGRGVEEIAQEITLDYKDSDKDLVPHPWVGNNLGARTAVLITLDDPLAERLYMMLEEVGAVHVRKWLEKAIDVGNTKLNLPGVPSTLQAVRARPKLTR